MKIGELAIKSGIAASAIRFYERSGLLPSAERGSNGYRVYGEETLERLRQIALGQALGFSLDAIRGVYGSSDGLSKEELLAHLDRRLDEIEQLQAALRTQSKDLRALRKTLINTWSQGLCADAAAAVNDLAAAQSVSSGATQGSRRTRGTERMHVATRKSQA